MKWPKARATENAGIRTVEQIVEQHGSIFRRVHQEQDVGIDGFIEFVENEIATGSLVAVQVKSGSSYLSPDGNRFIVPVDEAHVSYWKGFMVPVILVCHAPAKGATAWQPLQEYIEYHSDHGKKSIGRVEIPLSNTFDVDALRKDVIGLVAQHTQERLIFRWADMCLDPNAEKRRDGMLVLSQHPSSRATRLTAHLASEMILDEDLRVAQVALGALGYCANISNWSFRPDFDLQDYAQILCSRFGQKHIKRMVEAVEDGEFGPMSLGEHCQVCLTQIFGKTVHDALVDIAKDSNIPAYARANAIFLYYDLDHEAIKDNEQSIRDAGAGDAFDWIMRNDQ